MTLKEAIIQTYTDRFADDERYIKQKIEKIDECQNTQDLIYFCRKNLDSEALKIVSNKLNFYNFGAFVRSFVEIDRAGKGFF